MLTTIKYLRKVARCKKLENKILKMTATREKAKRNALKLQVEYEKVSKEIDEMKKR